MLILIGFIIGEHIVRYIRVRHLPIVVLACVNNEHDSDLDIVLYTCRQECIDSNYWLKLKLLYQNLQEVLLAGVLCTESLHWVIAGLI